MLALMAITRPRVRRIGILGFDGVTALDLVGPLEVFSAANAAVGPPDDGSAAYETVVLGLSRREFRAESGVVFLPHATLSNPRPIDTLIVPGGAGLREPARLATLARWIRRRHRRIRRLASVCTGLYALAESGLLDGRTVTTHWRYADDIARRYPGLTVDADAIFIRQGRYYTSAGISAGIDLALALVEEDHGRSAALKVARELVVYLKRAGGQKQFSEPLAFQSRATDRMADLLAWMLEHLAEDLSVPRLAQYCALSPRQFSRRFRQDVGMPPARYVERLRVEQAGNRLCTGDAQIDRIATSVGFASADVFRRAFERHFGIAPAHYRARFGRVASPRS